MKQTFRYQWKLKRNFIIAAMLTVVIITVIMGKSMVQPVDGLGIPYFQVNVYSALIVNVFFIVGDKLPLVLSRSLPMTHRQESYQSAVSRTMVMFIYAVVLYALQAALLTYMGGNIYSLKYLVVEMLFVVVLDQSSAIAAASGKPRDLFIVYGLFFVLLILGTQVPKFITVNTMQVIAVAIAVAAVFFFGTEWTIKVQETREPARETPPWERQVSDLQI